MCHLKGSLYLLALPKESLGYTMHAWVCHLKCSLCLLPLPKESLGYTVLTDVCLALSSKKKSYSLFRQKSRLVSPTNLTPYWAPKDVKSSFIYQKSVLLDLTSLAYMSFNVKVQKLIGIIIAYKHCHLTPGI